MFDNNSFVSVIIPVFNASQTIHRAVKSVLFNECVSEIILVEDGSSDDSLIKCKELKDSYPKVKLYTHEKRQNKGASASRNLGLKVATSDWIQFLDADDELLDGKIKHQLELIQKSQNTPLVVGNYYYTRSDEMLLKVLADKDPWLGIINSKLGITSSNLWNKGVLDKIDGWNESLTSSQEYDLLFRILKENDSVVYDDTFLTKIHHTSNSISTSKDRLKQNALNRLILRKKIEDYLLASNKYTLKRKIFLNGFIAKNVNYLDQYAKQEFVYNKAYFFMYKVLNKILFKQVV